MAIDFWRSLWGYMNFKMQILIHFWATLFSFGSCVFGCPFTNIAWNFGWVEVIKSLAKDDFFWILQKFSHTLNLDFSKLWLLLTLVFGKSLRFLSSKVSTMLLNEQSSKQPLGGLTKTLKTSYPTHHLVFIPQTFEHPTFNHA